MSLKHIFLVKHFPNPIIRHQQTNTFHLIHRHIAAYTSSHEKLSVLSDTSITISTSTLFHMRLAINVYSTRSRVKCVTSTHFRLVSYQAQGHSEYSKWLIFPVLWTNNNKTAQTLFVFAHYPTDTSSLPLSFFIPYLTLRVFVLAWERTVLGKSTKMRAYMKELL